MSTPRPTLAITRRLPEAVEARARADFAPVWPTPGAEITQDVILGLAKEADALLISPGERLTAATIAALPSRVRVVGTFSVGFDHIDRQALGIRRVPLVNTPDVLSLATAELALTLLLMAARRAGEGERLVRAGRWTGWTPTQLMGQGLAGRRLGIFGMGRIGRELARLARGIGMEIHYRNNNRLPLDLEQGAIFHDSDASFLAACETLSLNAPGGAGTKHWLNAERIAHLPRGAIVVNTARGTLVDDAALIAALRSGHIGAAGLDVYDGEPLINPDYLTLDNVVLLPHLGSAVVATREAMGFMVLDGIASVLAGQVPANVVALK